MHYTECIRFKVVLIYGRSCSCHSSRSTLYFVIDQGMHLYIQNYVKLSPNILFTFIRPESPRSRVAGSVSDCILAFETAPAVLTAADEDEQRDERHGRHTRHDGLPAAQTHERHDWLGICVKQNDWLGICVKQNDWLGICVKQKRLVGICVKQNDWLGK